jgi:MFS family permease
MILLVQCLASGLLFGVVAVTEGVLLSTGALLALGFFALGSTGVYYSCMATLVPVEQMGGATGGGQLALTTGALVAPPAFGYLADTVGYRSSWLLLAGISLLGVVFIGRVIQLSPPKRDQQLDQS